MMLRIYQISPAEDYEWIIPEDPAGYDHIREFIANQRWEGNWKTLEAKLKKAHGKSAPKETETPWLGSHVLLLKQNGLVALKDILEMNGVVVPFFQCEGQQLHAFRATVVDALNREASELWIMPKTDRVISIEKPVFRLESIGDRDLFRVMLPEAPCTSPIYVSERFVERYRKKKLRGLEFHEVQALE